jgi:hypothetical protein
MANGLGMQAAGGGGFMKKALGLVFMATVMNNTGLMSGLQDETKNTLTPLSSTKDETGNSTQSLLKTAASALLGV